MPSGLYDADGKIRLTQSPGSGFCGRYAPDGSIYFTTAPGSGFCGSTAPDGSMYIVDATGSTTIGVYAPNGAIRVTTGNEYNGAWRVSGVSSVVASWDASTSTLAQLAAITTHSRTSLATMFDSTGKLTYAPNNLLTYSNTFSNAAWQAAPSSLTAAAAPGIADPTGGTGTWVLTEGAAEGYQRLIQVSGAPANTYEIMCAHVKAGTGSTVFLFANGANGANAGVKYDLAGGTATNDSGYGSGVINKGIISEGNGWYFIWMVFKSTTTYYRQIMLGKPGDTSIPSYGGTGNTVYIYKAVTSAVTYETTPRSADQVITTSSAYYGPRIDYDPNTLAVKGLLIEEARTNLAINSSALTGGSWTAANMVEGSDATLDLTGATALKLTANAGAASHHLESVSANISVTSGTTYTQSWFAKAGTYSKAVVNVGASANWAAAVFDLSGTADVAATQTGAGSDTSVSGTSKYLGNGWFRLSLTFTASATGSRFSEIGMAGALTGNSFASFGEITFTAAGTETFYVGQPQTEAGSFATSYIPTAAASVTRAADVVQFTGAALAALQGAAFTFIGEWGDAPNMANSPYLFAQGNSSSAYLYLAYNGTIAFNNGTTNISSANTTTNSTPFRVGAAKSASGRSVVLNGGTVASDASSAGTVGTSVYLGAYSAYFAVGGHVRSLAIYNQRLADGTLQSKSVVGASY